jgi:transposase
MYRESIALSCYSQDKVANRLLSLAKTACLGEVICHCGRKMVDLGITEDSEYVTVISAQYMIIRQKRHKYGCDRHHDEIIMAPAPKRIKPGSTYNDEMLIDTAISKYCDLIPIERKAAMANDLRRYLTRL